MKKIIVSLLERSYPVVIGRGILPQLTVMINRKKLFKNIFLIIDSNVNRLHGERILELFKDNQYKISSYILPSGEKYKAYPELNIIYSRLIAKNFGRDSVIIGAGGGVTGDLAGFAASTFMRGVQLVHLPTTILAAVDSAVGGKTGINFYSRKNMIGTFYQPKFVLIDTDFFSTLPVEEKTSGLGEIIKYAFLSDKTFFNYVRKNIREIYSGNKKVIEKVVSASVSIKAEVVASDEKESGLRRILNLGHTFAHAIESDLKFKVKHGEAVIAGIAAALYLSNILDFLNNQKLNEYLNFLSEFEISPEVTGFRNENLLYLMRSDKKIEDGKIKFVLLAGIGSIILDAEAENEQILESLNKTREFFLQHKISY